MSSQPSQNITVNLVAGNTYYFQVAHDVPFSNSNDPEQYLYSPSGTQLAFNDDWQNSGTFPTSVLPAPSNTWSSFIGYTATVSGAYTLKVTTFPWSNTTPNPFTVLVSYQGTPQPPITTPPTTPGTTTGVPNVKLNLPAGDRNQPSQFAMQRDVWMTSAIHERRAA